MTYKQAIKPFLAYNFRGVGIMLKKGYGNSWLDFGLIINCYSSSFNPLQCADRLEKAITLKNTTYVE